MAFVLPRVGVLHRIISVVPVYGMKLRYYNTSLLGDPEVAQTRFSAFLDAYATSLDVEPRCYRRVHRRAADALWSDFVTISHDVNASAAKLPATRARNARN